MLSDFYKDNANDRIWWIYDSDKLGEFLFSFDKKKIFNLFRDYPWKLTSEQKDLFDRENPYWADFFKDRSLPNKEGMRTGDSEPKRPFGPRDFLEYLKPGVIDWGDSNSPYYVWPLRDDTPSEVAEGYKRWLKTYMENAEQGIMID